MRDSNNTIFLVTPKEFFQDAINQAMEKRKMQTFPLAKDYLIRILENYIHTNSLFDQQNDNGKLARETLAEMYLKAQNSEPKTKYEILRKMGDVSLYVSGFFGDSFSRKIIDVDYYINMGGTAYGTLAEEIKEDTTKKVFDEFSKRFLEFVDLLTFISQKSQLNNEANLLRLYEKYLKTGSTLAKEALEEKGILTVPFDKDKKVSSQ